MSLNWATQIYSLLFLPYLIMSRIIYDKTGTCRLTTDLWLYKRCKKRMYWMFNLWIQFYLYFASPYFGQNVLTDFEYHTNGISGTPRLNWTALKHNRKKDLGARLVQTGLLIMYVNCNTLLVIDIEAMWYM